MEQVHQQEIHWRLQLLAEYLEKRVFTLARQVEK